MVHRDSKFIYSAVTVFLLDISKSVCSSSLGYAIHLYLKIPGKFVHVTPRTDAGLCIYHLFYGSIYIFSTTSSGLLLLLLFTPLEFFASVLAGL